MHAVDTLIIGAGQAGLAMSYALSRRALPHLVLERGRIGERWLSERWAGLHFQTPNALVQLPGFPLQADDPDGFTSSSGIYRYLNDYAAFIQAPVRQGIAVNALRQQATGFLAETRDGPVVARSVVVATGPFQKPLMPRLLPETPDILQLHAAAYKAPQSLPDGAVLVVGTGASGAQIADELMRAGRQVYLSVSRHRRAPRRYRGHDHVWWWRETGLDRTPVDQRPTVSLPVIHTGAYGGYTMDFRDFARQGMVLLGRATAAHGTEMRFAPDLLDSLAQGDAAYLKFMDFVDAHVAAKGLDLPEDPAARLISPLPDALSKPILTLDLKQAGISTVIWATGYGLDFGWIDLPVFETDGQPKHRLGMTDVPGLYFLGLSWLSKLSSSFLFGVGDDAERLAGHIAGRA